MTRHALNSGDAVSNENHKMTERMEDTDSMSKLQAKLLNMASGGRTKSRSRSISKDSSSKSSSQSKSRSRSPVVSKPRRSTSKSDSSSIASKGNLRKAQSSSSSSSESEDFDIKKKNDSIQKKRHYRCNKIVLPVKVMLPTKTA
ncbi:serine/arginine-rich splicing factor 6-like [Ctenocephalides felis]|uniref:serine/arginine-rich splicing factor 6-like n=1 Tax=Ctenocephalides felis TaxID=7515 RepID=UPI000E6E5599|nr:serine/arginine-rich splicing factor 6-like [Ctenocephalides felis]